MYNYQQHESENVVFKNTTRNDTNSSLMRSLNFHTVDDWAASSVTGLRHFTQTVPLRPFACLNFSCGQILVWDQTAGLTPVWSQNYDFRGQNQGLHLNLCKNIISWCSRSYLQDGLRAERVTYVHLLLSESTEQNFDKKVDWRWEDDQNKEISEKSSGWELFVRFNIPHLFLLSFTSSLLLHPLFC